MQCLVETWSFEFRQRRQTGSGSDGVAMQRTVYIGVVGLTPVPGIGEINDLRPTCDTTQRSTAADDLSVASEIGDYTKIFLCPTPGKSKSGNNFIENQSHIVVVADPPKASQKVRSWKDDALHGLYDDSSQISPVFLYNFLYSF